MGADRGLGAIANPSWARADTGAADDGSRIGGGERCHDHRVPDRQRTPAPSALIDGGDGNLWFVDTNALGRISGDGTVKEFPITPALPPGADLHAVVPGANGVMWFDVDGMAQDIGKLAPDGTITLFAAGTNGLNVGAIPNEMTTGPDGTVWFTD